jgi:hypothetical protein
MSSVEDMFEYMQPTLIVSQKCAEFWFNYLCKDNPPPPIGFCYVNGLNRYTFEIGNTDCTSLYTIHIKRPDGSWVYHNSQQKTSWTYIPTIDGNYTIYVRQDNLYSTEQQIFLI